MATQGNTNRAGIAGFVLAECSLISIYFVFYYLVTSSYDLPDRYYKLLAIGMVLWILGLIFSVRGIRHTPRDLAIAGLCVLALTAHTFPFIVNQLF